MRCSCFVRRLCFVCSAAALAACAPADAGSPRAWIDIPLDGSEIVAGTEIEVLSHASAQAGVAEVMLAVDGVPYRRDPPEEHGAQFSRVRQSWLAEPAGDHALQVVAYSVEGAASSPSVAWVHVLPAPTLTPTPTPTPVATLTPVPTVSPTVPPTAYVALSADRTALVQGECTTLRWQVLNATSVHLDGAGVDAQGTRQVCPTASRTYRLQATTLAGPEEQSVTIQVRAPADTAPPDIGSVSASTGTVYMPNCTPNTVTITAQVSDAVGVDKIQVVYRVSGGSWETRTMNGSGGGYQATLDWGALEKSRDPVPTTGGTVVEYYIRARDAAGNTAESGTRSIAVAGCLI
jgi:hypothetical protein